MIYFIYGEDTFRSRSYLTALCQQLSTAVGTEVIRRSTIATTLEEVNQLLHGASLFSTARVIVLEDVFASSLRDELTTLIKTTLPTTTSLIVYETSTPDRRLSLFKWLNQFATSTSFDLLIGPPLLDSCQQLITQHQLSLSPQLASRLINMVGNDLWRLDRELDKLAAYSRTAPITTTVLDQLVSTDIEQSVFSILDSLSQRHLARANQLLADLVQHGEDPIGILAVVSWQLRNLIRIKALTEQGHSPSGIARLTGLHPYAVSNSLKQAAKLSHRWLVSAYQLATKIDWRIKQGDLEAHDAVDWLVATLAQAA